MIDLPSLGSMWDRTISCLGMWFMQLVSTRTYSNSPGLFISWSLSKHSRRKLGFEGHMTVETVLNAKESPLSKNKTFSEILLKIFIYKTTLCSILGQIPENCLWIRSLEEEVLNCKDYGEVHVMRASSEESDHSFFSQDLSHL